MIYRFGLFEFDAETCTLRRSGQPVALERQPAKALARLLASAGETVSREEMKQAIWGEDTHVDFDRGLAYCLSSVRRALGDSGENPRFIQTIPRQGYRFIAPVQSAQAETIAQASQPRARKRWLIPALAAAVLLLAGLAAFYQKHRTIVAVSIFDNETGLPEHDRLVAGLSDVVLTRLSEIAPGRIALMGNVPILRQPRNIRNIVAIRNSVKADYLILGQLQTVQTGGLRFITHLIRLSDQTHLKANRIPLPDGSVAGLETAVTAEFERAVRTHVLPGGGT